ncbi:hypothetical protein LV156_008770 [Aspergillus fumigatus]|nr:hypothetical protein LV156_008770 [Aspergillus fumigatus]KAJ8228607.1 hypothetical protein LV160_008750 [Aspergillus fumigatus]
MDTDPLQLLYQLEAENRFLRSILQYWTAFVPPHIIKINSFRNSLSNINLSSINLSIISLSSINLSSINLSIINLSIINLSSINLSSINLSIINLSIINLSIISLSIQSNNRGRKVCANSFKVLDVILKNADLQYNLSAEAEAFDIVKTVEQHASLTIVAQRNGELSELIASFRTLCFNALCHVACTLGAEVSKINKAMETVSSGNDKHLAAIRFGARWAVELIDRLDNDGGWDGRGVDILLYCKPKPSSLTQWANQTQSIIIILEQLKKMEYTEFPDGVSPPSRPRFLRDICNSFPCNYEQTAKTFFEVYLDTYAHDSLNNADIEDFRAVLHPVPRSPPIRTLRRTPPVTFSINSSKSRKRPRLEDDASSARSCMSPASGTASRNDGPTKAPHEHLTGRPADPAKTPPGPCEPDECGSDQCATDSHCSTNSQRKSDDLVGADPAIKETLFCGFNCDPAISENLFSRFEPDPSIQGSLFNPDPAHAQALFNQGLTVL